MAYVLKTETLPVDQRGAIWNRIGHASPSAVSAAREHLVAGIRSYEDALRLTPDDPVARLGYGWCLEQSGNRGNAIAAYSTSPCWRATEHRFVHVERGI